MFSFLFLAKQRLPRGEVSNLKWKFRLTEFSCCCWFQTQFATILSAAIYSKFCQFFWEFLFLPHVFQILSHILSDHNHRIVFYFIANSNEHLQDWNSMQKIIFADCKINHHQLALIRNNISQQHNQHQSVSINQHQLASIKIKKVA